MLLEVCLFRNLLMQEEVHRRILLFNYWRLEFVIIMINGAFGVGKTSVANCLVRSIENSMIYDPEEVGVLLRNIIPREIMLDEEKTNDFQDLILWKKAVVMIAREIKEQYNKHLIIPMTIRKIEYFKPNNYR